MGSVQLSPIIYSITSSRSPAPSPAAQPLRHQHDGLAVDLGVIPLTHRHLEIRRARGKRRAGPPAVGLEQIGGRGQHIWDGMAQIDMAVAVVVDAVLDVRRRQKLCLADLAGIGADEIVQRQIAALDDLQGGDKLALEQLGAAAVMRQRRHRADHRQLAHVARAVVAFQRPDRDDHRRGHAELLLDAPEQRGVHLHQFPGAADAAGMTRVAAYSSKLLAWNMPRWRRSKARTAGSGVKPAKAWSMTARETPWPCASRAIAARKALKSPPHGAASAGAVRSSRTRARRRRQDFPIRVSYPAKSQPVISQPPRLALRVWHVADVSR